jgi:hypothetical protein
MGYRGTDVLALLQHARVWLEPRLNAEVSYAEIVEGRLRAPSWRGLFRSDFFLRTAPRPAP